MKPVTRKEMFMEALANGCACAVEPTTREEMYLAAQAEREASGGSGGGGYDLVINATGGETPRIHSGSYEATRDKMLRGEVPLVCILHYCNIDPNEINFQFDVEKSITGIQYFDEMIIIYIGEDSYRVYADRTVELYQP